MLDETEISIRLEKVFISAFPARSSIAISALSHISDGWETEVFSFRIDYLEEGEKKSEDLILRIYPGADAAEKSAREFAGLRQLHASGYPVPRVSFIESDTSILGRPFMVMEKIEGESLGAILKEATPEKREELMTLFCRLFVDLHRLDWHSFAGKSGIRQDSGNTVVAEITRWQEYVQHLDYHDFDPLFAWLLERAPAITHPAVIHWDFHPFNILLKPDGNPSVIDWGNIQVFDFRFDLAWSLLLMSTYGSPGTRHEILTGYERAAEAKIADLEYFDAAACVRRLGTIMLSLRSSSAEMGMRPGAEKMMLAYPDHLRSVYALLVERTGIAVPALEKLLSTLPA